jgi:pimeloyl-ACP methyl ester carboxylesterase
MELCCVDIDRVSPDIIASMVELAEERAQMEWANSSMVEAARSLLELAANEDGFFAGIRAITAPTLLINGDSDRLVPLAAAQRIANMRPDWTFEVFADTGHVPQLERPAEFLSTVTNWLDSVALKESVG